MEETGIEFSRPVQIAQLGDGAPEGVVSVDAEANVAELAALAERYGLISAARFRVNAALALDHLGQLVLRGRIEAEIVQSCVVSLEPVAAEVAEDFEVVFSKDALEVVEDEPEMDLPEPWPGEVLDVGEVAAQQLGLALNPYPRAPGAKAEIDTGSRREGPEGTHRPFSGLAKLRNPDSR